MTKFNPDGSNMTIDPFDGTEVERRILVGPYCKPDPEDKYPLGRAIPTAFWISYFTLHWLTILEVVERSPVIAGTTVYFLVAAVLSTVLIAASEVKK